MIGRTISHYKILEKLGEGGMGVVYKAQDTKLLRTVALKFLSPDMTRDQDAKKRFIREARAASSMDHPNIAVVHDIDETEDGHSFICMAYYEGHTLASALSKGPFFIDDAVRIVLHIAAGLESAHDSGIVHRDIKPSNIILTTQGEVKIVDFGLAKLSEQARDTTQTTGGTAAYMSPEQILGNEADARSDLFSLGVVLYETATGKRPFIGDHETALYYSIVNSDPLPPSSVRSGISPDLERIMLRMLEKDPNKRYQSASDVIVELKQYLGEKPTAASIRHLRKAMRGKYPAPIAVGTVLVLAAIILYLTGTIQRWIWPIRLPDRPTIGVMPFENTVSDESKQYICDGLFESVTGGLARIHSSLLDSRIIPATEMRAYRNKLRQACNAYQLTLAVEGSVVCLPGSITVKVNLVDGDSLSLIDSRTVGPVSEATAQFEQDVLANIADMMRVRLRAADWLAIAAGKTQDTRAYDLYYRGRKALAEYPNLARLSNAVDYLYQALTLDSRFTLAYAALGEVYWRRYEAARNVQWVDSARWACDRARSLDSTISEVRMTLGLVLRGTGQYQLAAEEYKAVIALDSMNGDVYKELGETYWKLGDTSNAVASFNKGIALRPKDWMAHNYLARFYFTTNRDQDAIRTWEQAIAANPNAAVPYSNLGVLYYRRQDFAKAKQYFELSISKDATNFRACSNLGTLYYYDQAFELSRTMYEKALKIQDTDHRVWAGCAAALRAVGSKMISQQYYEKAIALAEPVTRVDAKDARIRATLAGYYADVGRKADARSMLAEALALAPADPNILGRAAAVMEGLGDRSKALDYLKQAIQRGFVTTDLEHSPEMKDLRKDPRYIRLTKKETN